MRAIFHADREWGIGKANGLMFSLPKDMEFFRKTTSGKTVVMGRNTLLSFPGGRPLKNRVNIVLSPEDVAGDVVTVHDLGELFAAVKRFPQDDVFVIGGASVYKALLPYCTEALVTKVDAVGGADVFAPDLDADPAFSLLSESAPQDDNGYTIRFCTYANRSPKPF